MVVDCGAEPIELYTLKWLEVDLEAKIVTFISGKGKKRSKRHVEMTDVVIAAL